MLWGKTEQIEESRGETEMAEPWEPWSCGAESAGVLGVEARESVVSASGRGQCVDLPGSWGRRGAPSQYLQSVVGKEELWACNGDTGCEGRWWVRRSCGPVTVTQGVQGPVAGQVPADIGSGVLPFGEPALCLQT